MITSKEKWATWILYLLIFSIFLPYSNDLLIRLDQLIVYILFLYFILRSLFLFRIPLHGISFIIFVTFLLFISSIGTYSVSDNYFLQNRELYYIIADLESFIIIIALVYVVSNLLNYLDINQLDKVKYKIINFYIILLCIHTLLMIFVTIKSEIPDFILNYYWQTTEMDLINTVAGRSYLNARFTGIFQQPMEVGCAYMIGLLLFAYKCNYDVLILFKKFPILILLLIGGFLPLSKAFYLGIFIFTLLYFLNLKKISIFLLILIIISYLGFIILIFYTPFSNWNGMNNILIIYEMVKTLEFEKIVNAFSGGRFGSVESAQSQMFNQIIENSRTIGFGFGSFAANEVPVDSGYMHIFYLSGVIGLFSFTLALFTGLLLAIMNYYNCRINEYLLMLTFIIYIVIVNLGVPIFVLNRVSLILFLFLIFFIIYGEKFKKNILRQI